MGIIAAMSMPLPSLQWRALRPRTTFVARVVLPLPGMPEMLMRTRWEGRALERSTAGSCGVIHFGCVDRGGGVGVLCVGRTTCDIHEMVSGILHFRACILGVCGRIWGGESCV